MNLPPKPLIRLAPFGIRLKLNRREYFLEEYLQEKYFYISHVYFAKINKNGVIYQKNLSIHIKIELINEKPAIFFK